MPPLRAIRAARLLSIRELAQQAGVAPSTVYLIETGRVTPRQRVIRQLAAALGVAPATVDEFRQAIERAQHRPDSRSTEPESCPGPPSRSPL